MLNKNKIKFNKIRESNYINSKNENIVIKYKINKFIIFYKNKLLFIFNFKNKFATNNKFSIHNKNYLYLSFLLILYGLI